MNSTLYQPPQTTSGSHRKQSHQPTRIHYAAADMRNTDSAAEAINAAVDKYKAAPTAENNNPCAVTENKALAAEAINAAADKINTTPPPAEILMLHQQPKPATKNSNAGPAAVAINRDTRRQTSTMLNQLAKNTKPSAKGDSNTAPAADAASCTSGRNQCGSRKQY